MIALRGTDDGHNAAIQNPPQLGVGHDGLFFLDERLRFDDGEFVRKSVKGGNELAAGAGFDGDEA